MMRSQYADGHHPYPNAETVTGLDYHAVHRLVCIPVVGSAMSYLIPNTYTLTQGLLPLTLHNYMHTALDITL